ncbi:hypothetical protein HMPREF1585_01459 [Gardnerella vaginalis JCP8481B]|nr:hypothetical protein HMPREF1585_01459 [Gardnerella vaginalis JCP8481B]
MSFNINALRTLSIYCLKNTSIRATARVTPKIIYQQKTNP